MNTHFANTLQRLVGCVLMLTFFVFSLSTASGQTTDWKQWRGTHRTGHLPKDSLPKDFDSAKLKAEWKVPLSPSYSGPLVAGDRIFVTETVDKRWEQVSAIDKKSGKILWKKRWEGSIKVPFFAKANGDWIRSTPVVDGKSIYVLGIRDVLVSLNIENGKILWKKDFAKEFQTKNPDFGAVCSPLVDGDFLYLQAGNCVTKLDKKTGSVVWRAMKNGSGMMSSGSFSSPIIGRIAGTRQLIVQGRNELAGINLESGKVLWKRQIPTFRGMNIQTPVIFDEGLFVSSYGGKSLYLEIKKNQEQYVVTERWKNRAQGYMASPVVVGNHLYTHLRNQRFACYDLKSGKEKWRSKTAGKYASLVTDGKRVLALDERGILILFRASPEEYEELGRKKVASDSWAHLAVSGTDFYVRDLNELIKIRWGK